MKETENQEEIEETQIEETDQPVETEPEPVIEPVDIKKEQDDLLEYCFKAAIKLHLQPKKEQLPVLCSTFYSQMMLPSVPTGKILEIKKSSAKKLSTFFTGLPDGVLKLETVSKGVEQIVSVDFKNSFFRGFSKEDDDEGNEVQATGLVQVMGSCSTKDNYAAPVLTQLYANSGNTRDIFRDFGL